MSNPNELIITCTTNDDVIFAPGKAVEAIRENNDTVVKIVFPDEGGWLGWRDQLARWQSMVVEGVMQSATSCLWFKMALRTNTITIQRDAES